MRIVRPLAVLFALFSSTLPFCGGGCNSRDAIASPADALRSNPQPLAFPGAEGYGRFAIGGRGGRVIEVTNLDDYDPKTEPVIPGSFRAAIDAAG